MALQICRGCGTPYSAGAPHCPECSAVDWVEEGQADDAAPGGGDPADQVV